MKIKKNISKWNVVLYLITFAFGILLIKVATLKTGGFIGPILFFVILDLIGSILGMVLEPFYDGGF